MRNHGSRWRRLSEAFWPLVATGLVGCNANTVIQPEFTFGAVSNSVDERPPSGLEAAMKGAAGFFGSILLGPLLGGGAAFGG